MEYDATIRVAIGEYEYIEICHSGESTESLVELARTVQNQVHGGEGVPAEVFRGVVDKLVSGETVHGGMELWEKMSKYQQDVCQEIKRAMKRKAYKNKEE